MKRKGFTLIELLAVIVILAIIALIATPIVLDIIKDTKESSQLRSAEFYVEAVEESVAKEKMNNTTYNPSTCEIKNKKLYCDGNKEELPVDVKGEKPESGTITLENGEIKTVTLNYSDNKVITKNSKGKFVYLQTPKSFEEDSWETIVANVKAGNTGAYKVGDTKEIKLTGFTNKEENSNGLYTIRIANNSTPEECNNAGFSQTACGFVIEFVDIIATHAMNSSPTNVGGWPASEMRTYVNNDIYNALPEGLKENIINTKVVSSHGSTSGETNFISEDKIYLLSTKEVWGKEGTTNTINYDTAETETRQLDYYKTNGVTTDSSSGAIKNYNGSSAIWWLRSAGSIITGSFYGVYDTGNWYGYYANDTNGVAVAFRI